MLGRFLPNFGRKASAQSIPVVLSDEQEYLLSDPYLNIAAFGEQVVAEITPVVQIANKYRIDPSLLKELEVYESTGGTGDNNDNKFRVQSGTSVGGYGVIRSKENIVYRAGEGIEARFTASFTTGVANSLQFGGLFSLTEILGVGYNGADLAVLHSYGGAAECRVLTVTAAATGGENATITLDGVASGPIALTAGSVQLNAYEIAKGLSADVTLNPLWRFEQVDDKVICIAKSAAPKAGVYSFSSATATASIVQKTPGLAKTDAHINNASWNMPVPFIGYDPTKLNVYKITFGYLGVANIVFSVYDPTTRKFVVFHQIEWSNTHIITHLGNPDLKIGWTAASLGASGVNLTVEGASAFIGIQGKKVVKASSYAATSTKASIGVTLTNLLTIKNRVSYANRFNMGRMHPLLINVSNDHNKTLIVEVYANADVAGQTNFQLRDEFNSIALYDTTGGTVTNGIFVASFTVAAGNSKDIDLTPFNSVLLNEDRFVIGCRTEFGTAVSTTVTANWEEEK